MVTNVLLVEDDELTIDLMVRFIKKNQFANNIKVMHNGKEALAYFEMLAANPTDEVPELVFLDLNMPLMNGWEFLDIFTLMYKKKFSNTSVCVLSVSTDPEDQLRALSYSSVIEFLPKPINKGHLQYLQGFFLKRKHLYKGKNEG